MEQYQFYEEIGCGGFSTVYKGRLRRSVEFVAIRRIEKGHSAKISAEVQVMHAFDHANVLKFQAWFATTNHLWVISEYCAGGDLRRLLLQDGSLPEETVLSFGLDVLAALHYVHSHGVLVIDLRPTSMLINEYGVLKLADFGHARCMDSPLSSDNEATIQRLALLHELSPSYIAPELLSRIGGYSAASDFWALGSLLVEMATGLPPYANCRRAEDMVQAAMFAPLPHLPESSELLNDLLQRLHAKRAADRPDAAATAAADAAAAADRSLAEMAATATAAARERLKELGATTQPAAKAALQPLSRVLFSPAEMAIRPVMLNAAIEKLEPTGQYEARSLKFRAYSLEELLTMDIPTLEAFLATLWRSVGGPNPVAEKENTLLYFEALATNGRLATVLINSGLTGLFSTMLRTWFGCSRRSAPCS
ncbi:serine threonine-protein kinase ulk4-like protein [Chrysochromulina tobinii]|uniref:Serine threonine-protein kinase ulk4-like protein n=1 Tax=Chrysochromulina tobinii TaxID=1460289 RepID=A0A0M0JSY9_9EUKA|nr:serine threonine-protein kinase ulk4-like protein [Chrysochromulina tobinii]|eukprot:KOO29298.1 serine threonine-protein kinase ulk4-like protein [Chrysochromulina sp. CCMP291]